MEELEQLLDKQNGCCAICKKHWRDCVPPKNTTYDKIFLHHLCIDHDHETQNVRGLLCNACNTAIGFLEEDEERFANAVHYLRSKGRPARKQLPLSFLPADQWGFQTSCDTVTGFGSAL